jgi:mRNA interferase RelE/StbE
MIFTILFSKSVLKTILKFDKPTRERIYKSLNNLPDGDIKKLKGNNYPPYFRLRIGKLRALFIKDDNKKEILVFEIDSRGEIYK